jgi:hypothetical protein
MPNWLSLAAYSAVNEMKDDKLEGEEALNDFFQQIYGECVCVLHTTYCACMIISCIFMYVNAT